MGGVDKVEEVAGARSGPQARPMGVAFSVWSRRGRWSQVRPAGVADGLGVLGMESTRSLETGQARRAVWEAAGLGGGGWVGVWEAVSSS